MEEQVLAELQFALARFCDEVVSDVTIPTQGGFLRRVRWVHRGREFRASVRVPAADTATAPSGRYTVPLPRHLPFEEWSSAPIFEQRSSAGWERAVNVAMWRWMLVTGMQPGGGDANDLPGNLSGRPIRPRPGLPSLRASAAAEPEPVEYESRYHRALPLSIGGRDDEHDPAYS